MKIRPLITLFLLLTALASRAQWSLDSCISYAYHHNISIQQQELNTEVAGLNQVLASGAMLPNLNASATHGYNWGQRIDPFTNQFASQRIQSNSFGLATGVTLFAGFQNYNTLLQSRLNTESAKWEYERLLNDVALNVASGYLTVLLNREFTSIAEANVEQSLKQVRRLEKLFQAGQIAEGSLNDIRAQLASNEASLVAARNNYDLSRLSLMQLLNLPADLQLSFAIVTPKLDDVDQLSLINDPRVVVESALRNFPQIRSAETNVASALIGEKIARGAFAPRLTANFSYGTGYSGAARVLVGEPDSLFVPIGVLEFNGVEQAVSLKQPVFNNDDYRTKSFGSQWTDNVNRSLFFNLTLPVFNGFSNSTGLKRARINRRSAELQLEQTRLTLEQNVQRAYTDAKAALSTFQAASTSTEASRKAFNWTEQRYEQGVVNAVDFADAQNRLLAATATETRAKYDYFFRIKVLDFYLGKPLSLKQ
jgi:outer membrane protein